MSRVFSIVMGALAVVGLALGGIAYASIPDSGGLIHGCYDKNNGNLRVIDDASAQCRNSETALSWNEQGPQGLQGPQGGKGDKGDAGRGIGTQYERRADLPQVQPGTSVAVDAQCDAGDLILSGGFGASPNLAVTSSEPVRTAGGGPVVGWGATATNTSTTTGFLSAIVWCADVTP